MPYFDLSPRSLIGAFITWLIPLAVSFGLYDPATGVYLPNFLGFKLIMAALAAASAYATYRWIARQKPLEIGVPNTYLALNAVLDIILLVAMFGMPLLSWLTTIFPIYIVVFYAIYALLRR